MTVHHLDRAPHREPVVVPADDEAARLERMRAATGESDARAHAERAGISSADYLCGIAQTGELNKEGVLRLLKNLPEGTTELICHPGYVDAELRSSATRLQESREKEMAIFTDAEVRNLVASQGIRLIDYAFVASEA